MKLLERTSVVASVLLMFTMLLAHSPDSNAKESKKLERSEKKKTPSVPLIPRQQLFGNPEKARARVSPDGRRLAFLAPVDDVLNVWVGDRDNWEAAKPVTKETLRGIRSFSWAHTSDHILYSQDKDGDEDFHIYAVDLKTGDIRDLTPLENIAGRIVGVSEKFPREILVGINDRGEGQLHDVYRIDILTGERELVQLNPGFAGFLTDDDFRIRFGITYTPTAELLLLQPDGEEGWEPWIKIGAEDALTTGPQGFDKTGNKVYFIDSRNRNTAALTEIDLETGEQKVIAENAKADIGGVILHPTEKHVQAVTFTYERKEWQEIDPAISDDLEYLNTVADGELQITSRSQDDKYWTVAYIRDNGPLEFYLYDRKAKKAEFLFTNNPRLEELPLVKMNPVVIEARDGLKLVSYLSLPKHRRDKEDKSDKDELQPDSPLPMVLMVHGGPWARDTWGFDPMHQLLANRGYAVLSVNYRGSTGFGKEFINAADKEWAMKMHDDLIDAVNWAVERGIAQEDKVAIMGGSYGGYATLVGLTFTPQVFACGVDIVGPSNLVTLLQNPPPYWMPVMPMMKRRVGDYDTEEGRKFLTERSPLTYVERIERPLLIGQGKHDPRVKQAEADQIAEAMRKRDIPVTYVLFVKEGHGFARPQNRFAFNAITEAFLAEHLGGRFESIGDAFQGAEFQVLDGVDQVPGLAPALKEHEAANP